MEFDIEGWEVREKMTDRRGSPGVLVLSAACTVLYMNRSARELIRDMQNGAGPRSPYGGPFRHDPGSLSRTSRHR